MIHNFFLKVNSFKKNKYLYGVLNLAGGTAISQFIAIGTIPVLTRLYPPEQFGLASLYTSCVSILIIVATGRYELAIVLPPNDRDAVNLLVLCLKISALVSLITLCSVLVFGGNIATLLGNQAIQPWLYLLPLSLLSSSIFQQLLFWCNRNSQYLAMTTSRLQQTGLSSIFKIVLGIKNFPGGQITAIVMGDVVSTLSLVRYVLKEKKKIFKEIKLSEQKKLLRQYISHPLYLMPAHFIGVMATQIPVLTISNLFSLNELGYFSLAYSIVSLPTGLIGNSIGDVYRQRIAEAYNQKAEFSDIFIKTLRITFSLSFIPFCLVYTLSPYLFPFFLGREWNTAGSYAQILSVSSLFQLVFTPIDKGALVVGATRYIFAWQLMRLLLMGVLFFVASALKPSIYFFLWSFVGINLFLYCLDGIVEFKLSKSRP